MKPKIYISGKVSGPPIPTGKKFDEMKILLEQKGFDVVNPYTLVPPSMGYLRAMRTKLRALDDCQAIFFLSDSRSSPESKWELEHAMNLNIDMYAELTDIE